MSRLGASAWVLMAPSATDPLALEAVITHPPALKVGGDWLRAKVALTADVIMFERAAGHGEPWAGDLLSQGYRSAVQCRFGMIGMHSCHLWMLGVGAFSNATGASLAWSAHCEWPDLRRVIFELRTRLTEREVECLRCAAMGLTQAQISESMKCSPRTTRFHLENAMSKLGAESSIVAVQRALLLGLS